jgi:hypothetical protein
LAQAQVMQSYHAMNGDADPGSVLTQSWRHAASLGEQSVCQQSMMSLHPISATHALPSELHAGSDSAQPRQVAQSPVPSHALPRPPELELVLDSALELEEEVVVLLLPAPAPVLEAVLVLPALELEAVLGLPPVPELELLPVPALVLLVASRPLVDVLVEDSLELLAVVPAPAPPAPVGVRWPPEPWEHATATRAASARARAKIRGAAGTKRVGRMTRPWWHGARVR